MPRLFVGLELPLDIRQQLSLLRGGLPGARWIDQENYHITLRFIGDVDARVGDEIAHALSMVGGFSFSLQCSGLGVFGSKKPHSLWGRVLLESQLLELQTIIERRMVQIGLPPEGRKYTPHVTVARLRGVHPEAVARWLSIRGDFRTEPFEMKEFVLFSSRDSKGGGPYLIEERYPLVP